ncbi:MAG: SLBB domain-containing protein [Rikenellaceae bacterium]
MSKLRLFLLSLAVLATVQANGQSQDELIKQAKSMGVTDSQIDQVLNSNQSTVKQDNKQSNNKELNDVSERALTIPTATEQQESNISASASVFGREIFKTTNLTFAPNQNMPTPKDYVLSAGDEVKINIWGNSEHSITQKILPEGRIFIEDIGPVTLSGLTIEQAEAKIKAEMSKTYRGLSDGTNELSLTLGQLRTIKVNVVGEAHVPGTYTLSSFSTIFNAMYMAGGVNDIGSLRSVKLYRENQLISELDAYDYLLEGKSDNNVRLEDGDMIIISPYKTLVSTSGELKRNRSFELKEGETLEQVLEMAGSFKSGAYKESVQVERENGSQLTLEIVKADEFGGFTMMDGDKISVKGIATRYDNRITISGAVWYPGDYQLREEISTVKQLVDAASGLKGDEFAGRAQIERVNPDFTTQIIAVDIKGIMNGTSSDVELQKDDILRIPSLFDLRQKYTIKVSGAVNDPIDNLFYHQNMSVEDAIIMAGGLKESAAQIRVDIARRIKDPKSESSPEQIVEIFEVTLNDGLAISESGDVVVLEPFDEIYVKYSPGYRAPEVVSVNGEIEFRGDYILKEVNTRLSDVINYAGGIRPTAYAAGANIKRRLTTSEKERVETLLEVSKNADMKDSIIMANIDIESYSVGIDLVKALENPGSDDDIVLVDGDVIYIPKLQSTVKISGNVLYPNSVTYQKNMKIKDYVEESGSYGNNAVKRPIVVYMNGKVGVTKRVFFFKKYPKIEPGCEIVVTNKRAKNKASLGDIISLSTSTTYMAALIATVIDTMSN